MGPELTSHAVEAPLARLRRPRIARKHRPLSGIAGVVLFACMFLPASRGCGDPVIPIDMPLPIWTPYVYGLVFALVALARSPRKLVVAVVALRVMAILVTVAGVAMLGYVAPLGIVQLILGGVLLSTIGWSTTSEARIAATGIVVASVSATWFGFWAMTPYALAGMYLSLASALVLFLGCVVWLIEIAFAPAELPRARILRYPRRA